MVYQMVDENRLAQLSRERDSACYERDEALDALSNLQSVIRENLSYGLQFTGHTSRLEDAEAILKKHGRLPAAGGAE